VFNRALSSFIFILTGSSLNAQCLSFQFAEFGYEPATCRLAPYQSGNGVVYAAAEGGTGPYTYQWTNLQTGATTANTTWGGLNVGLYEIYVHDSLGCFLKDTIEVDSFNLTAAFHISSSDWDSTGTLAFLPFDGELILDAPNCIYANPHDPDYDTNYYWQLGSGSAWIMGSCEHYFHQDFSISTEGPYDITLVVVNKNGCTDTLTQTLLAVLPTYAPLDPVVICDYANGKALIEYSGNEPGTLLIYDVGGTLQSQFVLQPGENSIPLETGITFYKIVNSDGQHLKSGKFFGF
jgi:hypothetical protein